MYQVKFTNAFKKSYKLMKKRGMDIDLLDSVIICSCAVNSWQKITEIMHLLAISKGIANAMSNQTGF